MTLAAAAVLFFYLLVGHCLADYPLQGDFLAKAKNHTAPIPGVDWWIALGAHALIHGGFVAYLTGQPLLGVAEATLHFAIDHAKCTGKTTFAADQLLHVECKLLWVIVIILIARSIA